MAVLVGLVYWGLVAGVPLAASTPILTVLVLTVVGRIIQDLIPADGGNQTMDGNYLFRLVDHGVITVVATLILLFLGLSTAPAVAVGVAYRIAPSLVNWLNGYLAVAAPTLVSQRRAA